VIPLLESMTKAFNAYSKTPFLFVWGTLMYLILLFAFLFAAIGIIILYFVSLSIFGAEVDPQSLPSMAVVGVIALIFLFFSGGLNAALAKCYRSAFWKEKTSLTAFYSYAIDRAPEMFGIMLIREFVWLLLAGPAIAIFVLFLKEYEFMDLLVGAYVLFATFIIHMFFTPMFIAAGALGADFSSSIRHGIAFMRKKHVYFLGVYIIFAIAWLLNFIPFIQLFMMFIGYPVVYTAMVAMMEGSVRIERDDD
jgi:hypothetical protein